MDLEKHILHWSDGSQEALRTVPILEKEGFFAEALFWTHLAVEKALKAHVAKTTQQVPPPIHNLVRLAEIATLELTRDHLDVCDALNKWQAIARYGVSVQKEIPKDVATDLLARAREFRKWLIEKL